MSNKKRVDNDDNEDEDEQQKKPLNEEEKRVANALSALTSEKAGGTIVKVDENEVKLVSFDAWICIVDDEENNTFFLSLFCAHLKLQHAS
jgi:hypothetical protein